MAVVGSVLEAKTDVCFEWSIPDFFSLTDQRKSFRSPSFPFSGRIWHLLLKPRWTGARMWMSMFLEMQPSAKGERTVTFSIDIKEEDGSVRKKKCPTTVTFTEDSPSLGWRWPFRLDELKEHASESMSSNVMTFLCRIVSHDSDLVERIREPSKLVELEALSSNLKELFDSRQKIDVKLKVQDKEFQVHRAVLMARSPVFSSMFEHEMAEGKTGCVYIPDCDEETFGDFLEYLYTGQYECTSVENACSLYATCHKYDVKDLMSFCVSNITRGMTTENFCDIVSLAVRYDDPGLMSSVQTFFNQNSKRIFRTNEWVNLGKENFLLANRLLKHMS